MMFFPFPSSLSTEFYPQNLRDLGNPDKESPSI